MEIWKPVKNFEQQYEISNKGNLRSIDRYVKHYKGGERLYKGQPKKTRLNYNGYIRCNLKNNGKRYDFAVHRLVAIAFLDNPNNYKYVNHINGIKTDNNVENLEWCTMQQNIIHAVKHRLVETKLTDKQAMEIYNSKESIRKLGKKYGVSASIAWRIKNKKAYKHLFA